MNLFLKLAITSAVLLAISCIWFSAASERSVYTTHAGIAAFAVLLSAGLTITFFIWWVWTA